MASRLGLGRIIEWAKNADVEEVAFVHLRIGKIVTERGSKVTQADASHQVKRTRRTKKQIADTREGTASQMGQAASAGSAFGE
jgi:hypothetical protein